MIILLTIPVASEQFPSSISNNDLVSMTFSSLDEVFFPGMRYKELIM